MHAAVHCGIILEAFIWRRATGDDCALLQSGDNETPEMAFIIVHHYRNLWSFLFLTMKCMNMRCRRP